MNKLNIIFVLPSVSRKFTGVYEVSRNLALELQNLDCFVDVHSFVDEFTQDDLPNWKPIVPKTYEPVGVFSLRLPFFCSVINSNSSVGHIHSLWSSTSIALYFWSLFWNKPYVFTSNAYLFDSALRQSGFKKKAARYLIFNRIINKADCIQVNTMNEYDAIRNLGFKNPICLIPNGVNLPDLSIDRTSPWRHIQCTQNKKVLLNHVTR